MQECLAASWEDVTLVRCDRAATRTMAHASNFSVEWVNGKAGQSFSFASDDEAILLFPNVGGAIDGATGRESSARSAAIVPPGAHEVILAADGAFAILATHRADLPADAAVRNPKTSMLERPAATGASDIRVLTFEEIQAPADNLRMKFLRSATMSINMIEYDGPRDRNLLSPHSHTDFEQATLTVTGAFTHHLRADWGRNADMWREDLHLDVEDAAIVVIPPQIIHTTEGVGDGKHVLFDVFAPPREDFIAKGWVHNAAAYAE